MRTVIVGEGECHVTADRSVELLARVRGAGMVLALWDPGSGVAGLLHIVLPDSGGACAGRQQACRYADTGVPILFREACLKGAELRRLRLRLTGGATVWGERGELTGGRRNHAALRKALWRAGALALAQDVGGTAGRTVRLDCSNGRLTVRRAADTERDTGGLALQGDTRWQRV